MQETTASVDEISSAPDDEDEESLDDQHASSPIIHAAPASMDEDASPEPDGERWAGTMSRDWEQPPATGQAEVVTTKPKAKAKAKPVISLEEALSRIPPETLKFIKDKFKTDIHQIRAYQKRDESGDTTA